MYLELYLKKPVFTYVTNMKFRALVFFFSFWQTVLNFDEEVIYDKL